MDKLTITGITLALAAILGGSVLKGSGIAALLSPAAFVIVLVGTVAAIFVQTPMDTMKRALRILRWTVRPPPADPKASIAKIVDWSQKARKEGLLGLEGLIPNEQDEFTRKGLQFLVDGVEPEVLRDILETDIGTHEHAYTSAAKVYEGLGIYAPTLGIIGAVMGLMAVMQNLADPSKLGTGIAAAFVATIYGIASANLFFLPLGSKLKSIIAEQVRNREILVEGFVSIAEGENPRHIESKLGAFLHV
ncbi:MAG: flagellar motor protein [Oceanococcaceae bacterium]